VTRIRLAFQRAILATTFPAAIKEFIFFHKASKTLILADTIISIELDKVTEPWRTATKFTGMYHPYGQVFFGMRLPLLVQRQKAQRQLEKSTRGSRSVFYSAIADVSMQMPTR
jgi:hypothetical protein